MVVDLFFLQPILGSGTQRSLAAQAATTTSIETLFVLLHCYCLQGGRQYGESVFIGEGVLAGVVVNVLKGVIRDLGMCEDKHAEVYR